MSVSERATGDPESDNPEPNTETAAELPTVTPTDSVVPLGDAFFGDLSEMLERRLLRVLVTYSKTNFYIDAGRTRGFEYELFKQYEEFLNQSVGDRARRMRVVFVPVPFDQLLSALRDGRGDVAAAGLTITPERQQIVRFTDPYLPDIQEVVVAHRDIEGLDTIDDLAGERVYVRSGSSYASNLHQLSEDLVAGGLEPIEIVEEPYLATEDILELVNAGVVGITVADEHVALAWARIFSEIAVHSKLRIRAGGQIAWAVRNGNPELLASLNGFVAQHRKGSLLGNVLFNRYYRDAKWISNAATEEQQARLDQLQQIFSTYAERYGFDWLAIAAQAYQESELDNEKRGPGGAVGIMQIRPSTASSDAVDIADIHLLENNVHAGVKYLDYLRNRYFSDAAIAPRTQVDFAWAAYNAGPARIAQLRREAETRGFDPNQWFFNVEQIAAERIGRVTVDYVSNINKYYLTYRILFEEEQRRTAQKAVITGL